MDPPKRSGGGSRNLYIALAGVAWSVILVIGTSLYGAGQKDSELTQIRRQVEDLSNRIAVEMQTQDNRANGFASSDKELATRIEANRAERDAQIREVAQKVAYNTGRLDSLEQTTGDEERRIAAVEQACGLRFPRQ